MTLHTAQDGYKGLHPLLNKPESIGIAYREKLTKAYHERINSLLTHFSDNASIVRPAFPITLYYYSDNGGDLSDTAPKEIDRFLRDSVNVVSQLSGYEKPDISYGDTLAQSWVTGGFDLAQTTRYGMVGVGNVTFLNCAPRLDERGKSDNKSNKGEPIYVGILPNGHVISANSRHNFAHFKDAIENGTMEVFETRVQQDGTQFRSRDIFPTHVAVLTNLLTQNLDAWRPEMSIQERRDLLGKLGYVDLDAKLEPEAIPDLAQFSVSHIDVHGNIKTNTRLSELNADQVEALKNGVTVRLGVVERQARFTERMFDRATGELGFSTGSSGAQWIGAEHEDGFLEISIIGESAADAFNLRARDLKTQHVIEVLFDVASNDNAQPERTLDIPEELKNEPIPNAKEPSLGK